MRIPTATYRFQLSQQFGFDQARLAVRFLDALGITDLYCSPICQARPGSDHGYDVVAHDRVNPELGGEDAFRRLAEELRSRAMGLLLDIVPNHMSVGGDANRRWLDMLENGPTAESAPFFDVDWNPPKPELVGKVLLPVLPDQFGLVLTEQQIAVIYRPEGFAIRYGGADLPLAPTSWRHLLSPALEHLRGDGSSPTSEVLELESILRALAQLPAQTDRSPAQVRERRHETSVIKRRVATLYVEARAFRAALETTLARFAGEKGAPKTLEPLVRLLAEQSFRLSSWRVAAHEINYRRFFDINDLAAIRVEDRRVFDAVHALPFRFAKEGYVTGLRIDHVDGLYDPLRYLRDLQSGWIEAIGQSTLSDPAYVVVEKILGPGETLPPAWPVAGTTGYEFMNFVTGVLVDGRRASRLRTLVEGSTGTSSAFVDIAYECKKLILRTSLVAELTVLARRLDRISEQHIHTRDFTRFGLQETLAEVIACFPVYRTYIRGEQEAVGHQDRTAIEVAIGGARRRNPVIPETLFDFLRSVLLLEDPEELTGEQRAERRDFVMRLQQLTGPVTAKGVEDTAFYRYFPLAALEEVGGNPEAMGASLDQFHASMTSRAQNSRHGLSATDTHDAKRSEDVRARLAVLSEIPEEWDRAVDRWRAMNRGIRGAESGTNAAPDSDDEYLFYQTVLGLWPMDDTRKIADLAGRVADYMLKAVHEAKRYSSWINPNRAYDAAVGTFVAGALDATKSATFIADLDAFAKRIARPGFWNSLAQLVLKVAAPGVPDFYQGSELWSFHLVDPDNRHPIDVAERQRILDELLAAHEREPIALAQELLRAPEDGRVKMLLTALALRHRRANATIFRDSEYTACVTEGPRAPQVVAFGRLSPNRAVLVVTGRFFTRLGERASRPVGEPWAETDLVVPDALRGASFREVFTGRHLSPVHHDDGARLRLDDVFEHLPVAWIEAQA